jgi:hypothetical protein
VRLRCRFRVDRVQRQLGESLEHFGVLACAAKGCTTPVTLHAGWTDPARLRILIHDEAPGLPAIRTAGSDDEDGRGMHLISYGADAWGVCTHGPGRGKATWFELGARGAVVPACSGDQVIGLAVTEVGP